MPDKDELYVKYRVFYEPTDSDFLVDEVGHPAPMEARFLQEDKDRFQVWADAKEVEGPYYVLRPREDHHARVAMAAYAYSCAREYPQLATDLLMIVNSIIWEEETGNELQMIDESMAEHPSSQKPNPFRIVQ